MLANEIKALTRRFFEERNKGKAAAVAVIDETCATNMVFHSSTGRDIYGLKDFQQHNSELFSAILTFISLLMIWSPKETK